MLGGHQLGTGSCIMLISIIQRTELWKLSGRENSLVKFIGLVIFSLSHTYRIDEILRFAVHCILVMFNHST